MTQPIALDLFTSELFPLVEETFERIHGIYLDKGTSLFETLDTITAEEASRPRNYLAALRYCDQCGQYIASWATTRVAPTIAMHH